MNPEQLLETTMAPETRTSSGESRDAIEADEIFSILMGDEVEQRRQFSRKCPLCSTPDI